MTAVVCCRRDTTVIALICDGPAPCSSLESLGFAHVLLQCFCYSWPENKNSIQQKEEKKTFFFFSFCLFSFFRWFKTLTFSGRGSWRDVITTLPNYHCPVAWIEMIQSQGPSLFKPWIKCRLSTCSLITLEGILEYIHESYLDFLLKQQHG